jgi:hypothetical protein
MPFGVEPTDPRADRPRMTPTQSEIWDKRHLRRALPGCGCFLGHDAAPVIDAVDGTHAAGHSACTSSTAARCCGTRASAGRRYVRSALNAARISVANNSGSSQAAKWPPRSASLK